MEEIIQPETTPIVESNELLITETTVTNLNSIRKWTLFFSVLGFIMIGFLGLGFIAMLIASAVSPVGGMMAILAVVYAIIMAVYFFPVYYLFKFSNEMKRAMAIRNQQSLEESFRLLRLHFKIVGIITIVMLSLYIVLIGLLATYGMYFANLFSHSAGY